MIAHTHDPSQVRYASKTTPWLLDELFVLVTGQKAGWYAGSKTRSAKFSLLDRADRMESRLTHLENTCGVPLNPAVAPAPVPLPPLVSMPGFQDYFITASELAGTSSDSDKNDKVSTADSTPVDFSGTSAASKTTKATSVSLGGTPSSPKPQPKSNLGGHKRPAHVIDSSPTPAPRPIKKVKIAPEPKPVSEPWNDAVVESDSDGNDNDEPSRATKATSAKKPKKSPAQSKDVDRPDAAPSPKKAPSKKPAAKPATPSPSSKVTKTPAAPIKKKTTVTAVKPVKSFQVKKKPAPGTPAVSETDGDEIVVASPSLAASKKAAAKDKKAAAAAAPAGRLTRSKKNAADQDAAAAAEAAAAAAVAKVLGGSAKAKTKGRGKK